MEDAGMKTAIVIRTFDKDLEWLAFCLRSIHKFASGFQEVVVLIPEGQEHLLRHLTVERVVVVHDGQPGYCCQQKDKLYADINCPQAEAILHIDSDSVMVKPFTPDTLIRDGKPLWLMTPWAKLSRDEKRAWVHVIAKCVQELPPYEFMRRPPHLIPRWAYAAFRDFVKQTHDVELESYVMNQPGHEFSEFNTMGAYLWVHHRDRIAWHDTEVLGIPEPWVDQAWSYGGLNEQIKAKWNALLA